MAEDPQPGGPVARFDVVRHGYDRVQVNRYFQQLEAKARHASGERDFVGQQVGDLTGQLEAARREIASLTERLDKVSKESGAPNREERDARALEVAKSAATQITARAQAAADTTWAAAEQASADLRDHCQRLLADLDRQHKEIHTAHETIMESARAKAEEMTVAAERRRMEIDAAAERDRIRIDREFSESMNAKREALRKEVESARARSSTEAARRVRDAKEEADRRIAAATAEVDRLTALREQLAGQLRGSHRFLEEASATIKPLDQERDLTFEDTLLYPPPLPYGRTDPAAPVRPTPSPAPHPQPTPSEESRSG
jgi:chromosome segregation ATPase